MKKIFLTLFSACVMFIACNNTWNDYYFNLDDNIGDEVLQESLLEFFSDKSEYSACFEWLKTAGIEEEMAKNQYLTIWVVKNDIFEASGLQNNDTLSIKNHVNYLAFGKPDLKNGLRIMMLNNIYVQISSLGDDLFANKSKILNSYRMKNGVVHELDMLLEPKINIYEYLIRLNDDYSLIRDSIFKYNTVVFDIANSRPIGVDKTGNTVYDSVFYVHNPLFENAKFNSEFEQFTVMLPSNEVVSDCFDKLNEQYTLMGQQFSQEDTLLAINWIKEAIFFKGAISDFSSLDMNSAFNKVWRTSVQEIDRNAKQELSNGFIYPVTNLKIPNNVIISRIKSLVHYWQYIDVARGDEDPYIFKGLLGNPSAATLDATPKPLILPNYVVLHCPGDPELNEEFSVEFPPLERYLENGVYRVREMKVPPGEYTLHMGFHASAHPWVNVYFNGVQVGITLQASSSTPWNYDRVNETEENRIPGGTARWDGLGGAVGVVNILGDEMTSFRIKVEYAKPNTPGDSKRLRIYHWALKPTANNY